MRSRRIAGVWGLLLVLAAAGSLASQQPPAQSAPVGDSTRSRCFGAVGAGCSSAYCAGGTCLINGGSWELDECCRSLTARGEAATDGSFRDGMPPPACRTPWAKERARLAAGFSWTRTVNPNRSNRTGRVAFDDYCALPGSRVHRDDVRYCCSREAEAAPPSDHPDARICR